jgi:hypothetical protein
MKKAIKPTSKKVVKNTKNTKVRVNSVTKILTEETKQKIALKRKLNPQFSHVVSRYYKDEQSEIKTSFKASLIETNRRANLIEDKELTKLQNLTFVKDCKKAINYIAKNSDKTLTKLFSENVTKHYKTQNFVVSYNLNLVSKIVKLIDKNNGNLTYLDALKQIIIAKNYNKLNK